MPDKIMCITFLYVQNEYPATRFICQNFDNKRRIDNQKVQVADQIKRDICQFLVSSDVADDVWYTYVYKFLPVQNKYPATRFICHKFDK